MTSPRVIILSLLLLCAAISGCDNKPEYIDHQGNSGQFSDYRGQWLLINYWASWCKPCIKEIPELNQLNQQAHITVLGVDFDGSNNEELQQKIDKLAIKFSVLTADPSAILNYNRPSVLPTTLVITPKGELIHTLLGPQTEQGLMQLINQ